MALGSANSRINGIGEYEWQIEWYWGVRIAELMALGSINGKLNGIGECVWQNACGIGMAE